MCNYFGLWAKMFLTIGSFFLQVCQTSNLHIEDFRSETVFVLKNCFKYCVQCNVSRTKFFILENRTFLYLLSDFDRTFCGIFVKFFRQGCRNFILVVNRKSRGNIYSFEHNSKILWTNVLAALSTNFIRSAKFFSSVVKLETYKSGVTSWGRIVFEIFNSFCDDFWLSTR